jgi:hypothetical protein
MKWRTNTPTQPRGGSRRTRRFFTWYPTDILGDTYWFEWVHVVEEYRIAQCEGQESGWVPLSLATR